VLDCIPVRLPPRSVIHINFVPYDLAFDTGPIWTELRDAVGRNGLGTTTADRLRKKYGKTAEHLATRHYLMKQAVGELKSALVDICSQVPDQWFDVPVEDRALKGAACERARDRVLLAIDSFLFEFRSYLDLLAKFVHGVLVAINRGPFRTERLASGKSVEIMGNGGKLKPYNFLLYLVDVLSIPTDWLSFLVVQRNFFTHEGAPYCAIEDRLERPPVYDLIIMKTNIIDFTKADPDSFFRVSECQLVVDGIRALSAATQDYLQKALRTL
jgi:hypothetical protein